MALRNTWRLSFPAKAVAEKARQHEGRLRAEAADHTAKADEWDRKRECPDWYLFKTNRQGSAQNAEHEANEMAWFARVLEQQPNDVRIELDIDDVRFFGL